MTSAVSSRAPSHATPGMPPPSRIPTTPLSFQPIPCTEAGSIYGQTAPGQAQTWFTPLRQKVPDPQEVYERLRSFPSIFPEQLNRSTLPHFLALTNVQELGIDYLEIHSFMPNIQRYFSPTVLSLALGEPKGTCREIIYFIGLFQHVDDLKLLYQNSDFQMGPPEDVTLIPPFVPPLRGRLTTYSTRVGLLKDMIDLFGGIRSRYMDLYDVDAIQLLLDVCAETLKTLRLYPTDPRGQDPPLNNTQAPPDNFTDESRSGYIDISQNESLRTLEVTVRNLNSSQRTSVSWDGFLAHAMRTIESPFFSEAVLFYQDSDFPGVSFSWSGSSDPPTRPGVSS